MARLDDIQEKHEWAMAELECEARIATTAGRHRSARDIRDACGQAAIAFAELLQYHKTFKGAVATAHEIERAKQ